MKVVRIHAEGYPPFHTPLSVFLADNGETEEVQASLELLEAGEEITIGGGAAPLVRIQVVGGDTNAPLPGNDVDRYMRGYVDAKEGNPRRRREGVDTEYDKGWRVASGREESHG
jgi:hypothetical protein